MKNLKKIAISIVIILVLQNTTVIAQISSMEQEAESTLKSLFEISKAKNYDKAAIIIAYAGDDKTRFHTSAYNPANKEEMSQVKRICKKISALLDICDKYEFEKTMLSETDETKEVTIDVSFINGDQKLKTIFQMIKIGDRFLLSDMN